MHKLDEAMQRYELKNNTECRRYEFDLGGAVAVVNYELRAEGIVCLIHTGVPEQFSGQGIASELTEAVLEDIKRHGLKVVSSCSFITLYIERHPQWKELLATK